MRSPIVKVTSVAAVLAVAVLALVLWGRFSAPAYALEQTVEALQNVRFLHLLEHDDAGQIIGERWIEIGMDGWQVRYRQDNPLGLLLKMEKGGKPTLGPGDDPSLVRMAVEDGQSTARYRYDKKAVILYDRQAMEYQWVGELGKAFENLRQEGKILQANDQYKGSPAHKVWWPYLHAECYVDPQTKLPLAIGNTELSYEEPPAGTFDITTPPGYLVVDKRPGAVTGPLPDWLLAEEAGHEQKGKSFRAGTEALIQGNYAEAAQQFEQALGCDSWATYWLGSAYYGLGKYDLAIKYYGQMLKDFGGDKKPVPFCNYALGLAYARSGNLEAAQTNFQAALPAMIQTLRIPSGGTMFDYADDPLVRSSRHKPTDAVHVVKMVNRLRLISGQSFGYDPGAPAAQNEVALAAWEQWFKNGGQIKFTPDAKLLPVPAAE